MSQSGCASIIVLSVAIVCTIAAQSLAAPAATRIVPKRSQFNSGRSVYPHPKIPEGNTTVFAMAQQKDYLHVFALGADGGLYHKYQMLNQMPTANWTDWILRAKAPMGSVWDADPAVAVAEDGSLEVFIRQLADLDLWQLYQTDASNPDAWSSPRECSCIVMPCNDTNPNDFWNTQPVFPTSDVTILQTGEGGANRLFYRGFDGALYVIDAIPGKLHKYAPPVGFATILE